MEKININGKEFTAEELNKLIEQSKKEKKDWKRPNAFISTERGCIALGLPDLTNDQRNKHILHFQLQSYADYHNEEWKADWNNDGQEKFGIEHFSTIFEVQVKRGYNDFIFGISVKSQEIAKAMLEEFKDELEIYLK